MLPPLERFTAVVERPLFSPTRRMPPLRRPRRSPRRRPRRRRPSPAGPAEPELRFFGTVRQGGDGGGAGDLSGDHRSGSAAPGDPVGDWQVLAVERNRLELGLGDERRNYEIFGAGVATAPAAHHRPGAGSQPAEPPSHRPGAEMPPASTRQGDADYGDGRAGAGR